MQPEIINYVKDCVSKNYTKDQIKESLAQAGWGNAQIDEALLSISADTVSSEALYPHSAARSSASKTVIVGVAVILIGVGTTIFILASKNTNPDQLNGTQTIATSSADTDVSMKLPVESSITTNSTAATSTTVSTAVATVRPPVDCGTDAAPSDEASLTKAFSDTKACFYKQLKTCSLSTLRTPVINAKIRFRYDIESPKGSDCLVKISTIEYPIDLPADGSLNVLSELKNSSMECTLPKILASGLVGIENGSSCTGSLVNTLKKIQGNLNMYIIVYQILNWGEFAIGGSADFSKAQIISVGGQPVYSTTSQSTK